MIPMIVTDDAPTRALIESWFAHMGHDVCDVLADHGVTITVLRDGESFGAASPALRRLGAGVDRWPIPPAGLFVVEERAVILRSVSGMTFFHEVQHAIDLCLGGGVYRSGVDPRFRKRFNAATAFVTPYAASGCDEFWAESARAWWGPIANDKRSLWPDVSRERLRSLDEEMYELVRSVFEEEIPRMAAAIRAGAIAA
jgi:hypothetical protein